MIFMTLLILDNIIMRSPIIVFTFQLISVETAETCSSESTFITDDDNE